MAQRNPIITTLLNEHPTMFGLETDLYLAYEMILQCFQNGGKLILCGNGGSACDCEHIAGELMKGFLFKRPLNSDECEALTCAGDDGTIADQLQRALPVIVLHGLSGMSTAFLNDVSGELTYAQQAFAYAQPNDVLMGISTSGNAYNVCAAAVAVKACHAKTISLTGAQGGKLAQYCDVCIKAPELETYRVQECHLPIYHALCAALEQSMFGGAEA